MPVSFCSSTKVPKFTKKCLLAVSPPGYLVPRPPWFKKIGVAQIRGVGAGPRFKKNFLATKLQKKNRTRFVETFFFETDLRKTRPQQTTMKKQEVQHRTAAPANGRPQNLPARCLKPTGAQGRPPPAKCTGQVLKKQRGAQGRPPPAGFPSQVFKTMGGSGPAAARGISRPGVKKTPGAQGDPPTEGRKIYRPGVKKQPGLRAGRRPRNLPAKCSKTPGAQGRTAGANHDEEKEVQRRTAAPANGRPRNWPARC